MGQKYRIRGGKRVEAGHNLGETQILFQVGSTARVVIKEKVGLNSSYMSYLSNIFYIYFKGKSNLILNATRQQIAKGCVQKSSTTKIIVSLNYLASIH